jgi:hypothetical protein
MENQIYQVFSPLELKLYAYNKLSSSITCNDRIYLREFSTIVCFEGIHEFVFSQEESDILPYLFFIKEEIEKLLFNDASLNRLAGHNDISLEFSTIEEVQSELRTEINSYFKEINKYIDYVKEKSSYQAQAQNNGSKVIAEENKLFEFKESIVAGLLALEFNNQNIFDKDDYDKMSENVRKFISGEFSSISPKLNFSVSDKNYAYYLIHSLQPYCNFDLKDIANVTINGEDYKAALCSKAVTGLKKKERGNHKKTKEFFAVKDIVDRLINANRKEIR